MVNKKFTTNENTKQHQKIFKKGGIVYRKEFEELERRLKRVEAKLGIK